MNGGTHNFRPRIVPADAGEQTLGTSRVSARAWPEYILRPIAFELDEGFYARLELGLLVHSVDLLCPGDPVAACVR